MARAVLSFSMLAGPSVAAAQSSQEAPAATYAGLVPILEQRCVICHSGEAAPAGLRLDSYEALLEGSARGSVVESGDPATSELIRRIKGESVPRMPLTGPPYLTEAEIRLFEHWVEAGLRRGGEPTAEGDDAAAAAAATPDAPVTYARVAPILAKRCVKCHADDGLMGAAPEGFRMTSYGDTLSSSDRARVVPGSPDASELLRRVRGQSLPRMPFDGPPYLSEEEIDLIERWIAQGARDTEGRRAAMRPGTEVRLHGTLTGRWRLDGMELRVSRRTRVDKSPGPGDYVEVRGRLAADGSVIVERIRPR